MDDLRNLLEPVVEFEQRLMLVSLVLKENVCEVQDLGRARGVVIRLLVDR